MQLEPTQPTDGQMLRFNATTNQWSKVTLIDQETPVGVMDGVNRTFQVSIAPHPANGMMIFRNGIVQRRCSLGTPCDYDLVGRNITFIAEATPYPGDVLVAWYRY